MSPLVEAVVPQVEDARRKLCRWCLREIGYDSEAGIDVHQEGEFYGLVESRERVIHPAEPLRLDDADSWKTPPGRPQTPGAWQS